MMNVVGYTFDTIHFNPWMKESITFTSENQNRFVSKFDSALYVNISYFKVFYYSIPLSVPSRPFVGDVVLERVERS